VPQRTGLSNGFILSPKGSESCQLDIIVYDQLHSAPLYRDEAFVVASPDMVSSAISVKSNLTGEELKEAVENISTAKDKDDNIQGIVFGFHGMTHGTLEKHLKSLLRTHSPNLLPDHIVIASRGIIVSKVPDQTHIYEARNPEEGTFPGFMFAILKSAKVINLRQYMKPESLGSATMKITFKI
jgi:hypothetical protein